jgi:hypothetical protein
VIGKSPHHEAESTERCRLRSRMTEGRQGQSRPWLLDDPCPVYRNGAPDPVVLTGPAGGASSRSFFIVSACVYIIPTRGVSLKAGA